MKAPDDESLETAMRGAAAGAEADPIGAIARAAFAAELVAGLAKTDADARRATSKAVDKAHDLAALAGGTPGAIALKLATVLRLRAREVRYDFVANDAAELALLASALADCVILGDAPIGGLAETMPQHKQPNRAKAPSEAGPPEPDADRFVGMIRELGRDLGITAPFPVQRTKLPAESTPDLAARVATRKDARLPVVEGGGRKSAPRQPLLRLIPQPTTRCD